MKNRVSQLREQLLNEYAEIMLLALGKEAGVMLGPDEFDKAKEKLMEALSGITTV